MACCYIAAFCVGQLVKTCQFLDLDQSIRYNDDQISVQDTQGFDHNENSPSAQHSSTSAILSITGLTCSACVHAVTEALEKADHVREARVSLQTHEAVVVSDDQPLDPSQLVRFVQQAGYDATEGPRSPAELAELLQLKAETEILRKSFSGLLQYGGVAQTLSYVASFASNNRSNTARILAEALNLLSLLVVLSCQFLHVKWIHEDSWRLLKNGSLNMNSLISFSTILGLAFSILDLFISSLQESTSYGMTTLGLTLMVIAGRYLEVLSRRQASKHIVQLYKSFTAPEYVKLHPEGKIVPSTFLRQGDVIVLEPFSLVPCDSYVVEGDSTVNQSIITGESLPIRKACGDYLLAGSRTYSGKLLCVVHRERCRSFYAQLVQNVNDATAGKLKSQDTISIVTRYFAAGVVVLAFASPALQLLMGFGPTGFYGGLCFFIERAMTILVSACPCALGLAVPSAVIAAVDAAHSRGILLTRGASTLQELDGIEHIVFDKTGTLTEGSFAAGNVDLHSAWKGNQTKFWILICALEEQEAKGHPAGLAVFKKGIEELGSVWLTYNSQIKISETTTVPGLGVAGKVSLDAESWHNVVIGSHEYLQNNGILTQVDTSAGQQRSGITVLVGIDGIHAGTLLLQDRIRPGTREVLQTLKTNGLQFSMLTGDAAIEASRVAHELDIPILGSRESPAGKLQHIEGLKENGLKVAMVGDGLNDAPSLAAAHVGVIMPRESSIATIGGSVMILNSDLSCLPQVFDIARQVMQQIRFNITWAIMYNTLALSLATGIVRPFGLVLSPSYGALLMSASSVMITTQALRLRSRLKGSGPSDAK